MQAVDTSKWFCYSPLLPIDAEEVLNKYINICHNTYNYTRLLLPAKSTSYQEKQKLSSKLSIITTNMPE